MLTISSNSLSARVAPTIGVSHGKITLLALGCQRTNCSHHTQLYRTYEYTLSMSLLIISHIAGSRLSTTGTMWSCALPGCSLDRAKPWGASFVRVYKVIRYFLFCSCWTLHCGVHAGSASGHAFAKGWKGLTILRRAVSGMAASSLMGLFSPHSVA